MICMADPDSVDEFEHLMATQPFDAVITRTVPFSDHAMAACPTLKVIAKHGVGTNNIGHRCGDAPRHPVYVTPGANSQAVAEMTLGLMLAAARRISWMDHELHAGRWSRAQGIELRGRTLGLVGLGQVGQRVAAVCLALGMDVIAFSPSRVGRASQVPGVRLVPTLEALLPLSDVLSLHLPLNARTRHVIGAAQIAALPRGAILINTARGEIVDETALIAALQSGHLRAAGLDTMAHEPLPVGSALTALDNVVLTPHAAGSSAEALSAMAGGAARNALGWLQGRPVDASLCVNPQVLAHR